MNLQRRNLAAHRLKHMLQLQRALREIARYLRGDAHLLALGVHAKRHRTIRRAGLRNVPAMPQWPQRHGDVGARRAPLHHWPGAAAARRHCRYCWRQKSRQWRGAGQATWQRFPVRNVYAMIGSGIICRKNARKAAHPGHRRVRCRSPAQPHRRPLETAAAVPPVRRQGAALLGPGTADSRHLAKDAGPTAAPA